MAASPRRFWENAAPAGLSPGWGGSSASGTSWERVGKGLFGGPEGVLGGNVSDMYGRWLGTVQSGDEKAWLRWDFTDGPHAVGTRGDG